MTTLATETWTGTDGAAWPAQWTTGVVNAATATIVSNAGQLTYGTGASFAAGAKAYLSGLTAATNLDVTFDVKFANLNEQYLWVALRCPDASIGATPTNAYYINIFPGNGAASIEVDKNVAATATTIGAAATVNAGQFTAGVYRTVRFQAVGNTLQVKVWNTGSAEPGTWNWTGTDTSFTAATGKVWLGTFAGSAANAGNATIDNLIVTDGAATGSGSLALTGTGTLAVSGSGTRVGSGSLALTGTGTLTLAGGAGSAGALALQGTGSLLLSGSGVSSNGSGSLAFSGGGLLDVRGSGDSVKVIFRPPVYQRRMPIMPGLAALINYSVALLRINGQWVETEFPSEQQINAADLYFPGGYENEIDMATAALLTNAGYIGGPTSGGAPNTVGAARVGVTHAS